MGYIHIPVTEQNQDDIMHVFENVHIGSRVYFSGYSTVSCRFDGSLAFPLAYTPEEIYELIVPFEKTGLRIWQDWQSVCAEERLSEIEAFKLILDPDKLEKIKTIFKIDLLKFDTFLDSMACWELKDIRIDTNTSLNNDGHVLFDLLIEVACYVKKKETDDFDNIKRSLESKLFNMHFGIDDTIGIPPFSGRTVLIDKMFFSLKGYCDYIEVDEATIRREWEHIRNVAGKDIPTIHPLEVNEIDAITKVIYDYPEEENWGKVIECMGVFVCTDDDLIRTIKFCPDATLKTIRFLFADKKFKSKIYNASKNYLNAGGKVTDKDIEDYIFAQLRFKVIAHELGHMVFRSIASQLTENERESLANWFACLVSSQFIREMAAILIPYQSDIYQDFITIPEKYGLSKKDYSAYCNKINELLRRW